MTDLEKKIKQYQNSYYSGNPEIPDKEFDKLWDNLQKVNPKSFLLKEIGSSSWEGFKKEKHSIPMSSQQKASNISDFKKWSLKNPSIYICELKIDGLSLALYYENGNFVKAITRGDGITGDDISQNVVNMKGFKKEIKGFSGSFRCEIVMFNSTFEKYKNIAKNPRNLASGISKRKNGENTEDLNLIFYDAKYSNKEFEDEVSKLEFIKDCDLPVVDYWILNSAEEVISLRNFLMETRDKSLFDFDGIVIKGNEIDIEDLKRDRPKKQIAFKFESEFFETELIDVEWSLSGAYLTPVGIMKPIDIFGSVVKRASLANPGVIKDLGIKIGDIVAVSKRGEIIPKIEYVVESNNGSQIVIPKNCPSCKELLINEQTYLYCPNKNCDMKKIHQLKKWIKSINVLFVGNKMIEKLFENGVIKNISDFYTKDLTEIISIMGKLDGFSKNNITKAFNNIYEKFEVPLSIFVAGYDIDHIGKRIIKSIQGKYNTLEKICNSKIEELEKISGIGEITAIQIIKGIKENYEDMTKTLNSGKLNIIDEEKKMKSKLAGKSFCITGRLNGGKRAEYIKIIEENDGIYRGSVSKGLTFLVNNDLSSISGKNKKAKELGIPIIPENDFLKMV